MSPVADSHLQIAVECRDHGRVADVEWIDQLIGKYRDLRADRIVAVARSVLLQLEGRTPVRVTSRGEELQIADYFKRCHSGIYAEFMKLLERAPNEQFETMDSLNHSHEFTFEVNDENTIVFTAEGSAHAVNRMWWRCTVELSTMDLPTKRELFGGVGVIRADDHLPEIGAVSMLRVQLPGSPPTKPIVFRPDDTD